MAVIIYCLTWFILIAYITTWTFHFILNLHRFFLTCWWNQSDTQNRNQKECKFFHFSLKSNTLTATHRQSICQSSPNIFHFYSPCVSFTKSTAYKKRSLAGLNNWGFKTFFAPKVNCQIPDLGNIPVQIPIPYVKKCYQCNFHCAKKRWITKIWSCAFSFLLSSSASQQSFIFQFRHRPAIFSARITYSLMLPIRWHWCFNQLHFQFQISRSWISF